MTPEMIKALEANPPPPKPSTGKFRLRYSTSEGRKRLAFLQHKLGMPIIPAASIVELNAKLDLLDEIYSQATGESSPPQTAIKSSTTVDAPATVAGPISVPKQPAPIVSSPSLVSPKAGILEQLAAISDQRARANFIRENRKEIEAARREAYDKKYAAVLARSRMAPSILG